MQVQTYSSGMGFTSVFGGGAAATTDASGRLPLTVPALSAVVYRAAAALAPSTRNPIVTLTEPAEGAEVVGNVELAAVLDRAQLAEVTFALKAGAATEWTVLGTDDNPPYRIFYDVSGLAAGTPLQIKAIARDRSGNLDSDTATAVVGEVEPPQPGAARDYAVVHYQRPDGDYDGWGVHVWGDVNEPDVTWTTPKPLAGEDEYGRFAWVKLAPNASQVGFIVHKGDTKDPDGSPDRFFDPQQTPEIWLKSGDATVYTSRAAAQGYVELRYHRPDGVYTGWGLHLWGDAIDPTEATEWAAPKLPDRIDDYGAHWLVRIQDATKAVNFIVHKGDEKDTAEDRSFLPAEKPSVWLQSGDSTVYGTRGDAEDFALIHYHRDDGDYGDATSPDFNDFWGLHVWDGSAETGVTWQNPVRPIARDGFGLVFKVRLVDGAARLAYIVHRGDTKDPGPDQFLDLDALGHEVWILSGHVDADNNTKYLLPMIGGPGIDANLDKAKAHWLTRDTLVWNAEPVAGGTYHLSFSPTGGLVAGPEGVTGGESIRLYRARDLSDELKAKWPHLAGYNAFRIKEPDLGRVPEALRGQLAVWSADENGFLARRDRRPDPGRARRPLRQRRRARRQLHRTHADAAAVGADGAEREAAARHDIGADDPRRRDRRLERDRDAGLVRPGVRLRGHGLRAVHGSGRDEPRHRSVLRRPDDELLAERHRRPVRRGPRAGRLERRDQAAAAGARGHRALRAPHSRLLGQRHDRAGRAAGHVPGVHAVGLRRHASPARARGRGADARAPAAGVRHRHDRRDPGEPPATGLQPRVVPARVDGAAGVRHGRRRHGRLQLGLRPVALHGAGGELRDRPERRRRGRFSSARW